MNVYDNIVTHNSETAWSNFDINERCSGRYIAGDNITAVTATPKMYNLSHKS